MSTKRELVLKAFRGEEVDRVPVGFWHHFATADEWLHGLDNPAIIEKNIAGHKKFVQEIQPDFVKIMSDGYFAYPNPALKTSVTSIKELAGIQSIGQEHEWYDKQVELIRQVKATFTEDIVAIYNIFSPLTHLKWQLSGVVSDGDDIVARFYEEDKETLKKVLTVIAKDLAILVEKVIKEAGSDGIYYSVQTIQVPGLTGQDYLAVAEEGDSIVLAAANQAGGQNILHICGYEGASNDITIFKDYDVQVFNWAVGPEGISLAEGRKLFGGKTVLGGFENTTSSLIYTGSQADIEAETKHLIAENGKTGLIIGADCTVPSDIAADRIHWVRDAAAQA